MAQIRSSLIGFLQASPLNPCLPPLGVVNVILGGDCRQNLPHWRLVLPKSGLAVFMTITSCRPIVSTPHLPLSNDLTAARPFRPTSSSSTTKETIKTTSTLHSIYHSDPSAGLNEKFEQRPSGRQVEGLI